MKRVWHTTKGYIAGVVAFAACPCHLPITLPLLLTLTAGTAIGAWLVDNTITVAIVSTIIFIGGMVLAFTWINQSLPNSAARGRKPGSVKVKAARQAGVPKVTLLTASNCTSCKSSQTAWQEARRQAKFYFEEVEITSAQGRVLAAKPNIFSTPATIIDDHVVMRGPVNPNDALTVVGAQF